MQLRNYVGDPVLFRVRCQSCGWEGWRSHPVRMGYPLWDAEESCPACWTGRLKITVPKRETAATAGEESEG